MNILMKKMSLLALSAVLCTQVNATLQDSMDAESSTSAAQTTQLVFKDQTEIELKDGGKVTIRNNGETLNFDELNKPVFTNKSGESVMEYSGLASDKDTTRSWAKASLSPNGSSPAHYHEIGTEDYYVTSLGAKLMATVDGVTHELSTGDHIRITPGQVHQVKNLSAETPISFLVKCTPAWAVSDYKSSH